MPQDGDKDAGGLWGRCTRGDMRRIEHASPLELWRRNMKHLFRVFGMCHVCDEVI